LHGENPQQVVEDAVKMLPAHLVMAEPKPRRRESGRTEVNQLNASFDVRLRLEALSVFWDFLDGAT